MAAQVLAALQGVDAILIEGDDDARDPAAPGAHATRFQGTGWRKAGLPGAPPDPASADRR